MPALARRAYETYGVRPSRTYSRTVIPGGISGDLRHEREPPRELAPPQRAHVVAVERDRRPRSGRGPATARRSVVLPAPFGPISATHSPALDRERDAVDDVPAAELDRDPLERERAHRDAILRVVRSTIAKNGAPKNAVTTPIGSSAGDDRRARDHVREARGSRRRRAATAAAAAGSSARRRAGSRAGR